MRRPEDIIHNGLPLSMILANHAMWLAGEGGECADLSGANLTGVDLTRASLIDADLTRASLINASLTGANLAGANLAGANLSCANLSCANLIEADLTGANLIDANLTIANLTGANLTVANLLAYGNMRELRTMQFSVWRIGYTADTLQIGCQRHPIEKWRSWHTEAGRRWIDRMDGIALEWAERNLALVLAIIDANPATPTGHEGGDDG